MTKTQKKIRLVVSGCCGRMGSLLVEEASKDPGHFQVVGGIEGAGHPRLGQELASAGSEKITANLMDVVRTANLLMEFTTPAATLEHTKTASEEKIPMVIGTTGFSAEEFDRLRHFARRIPILWSPNMSIGIVIVRRAIASISQLLSAFQPEERIPVSISETHHAKKLDKPSGTAKALAQEIFKATGWLIRDEEIEAKREGEVIGLHAVTFHCRSEKITLSHEATDRRVFAQGALLIARYFHRLFPKPGWYSMDHFIEAMQKTGVR